VAWTHCNRSRALLDLVRKLTAQKIGIIYISHYLPEIFEIGDRVTILKDGRVVDTLKVRSTDLRTITRNMLGKERAVFYKRDHVQTGEIALRVRNAARSGYPPGGAVSRPQAVNPEFKRDNEFYHVRACL
jgi:ribose transport system ATP-binding protein